MSQMEKKIFARSILLAIHFNFIVFALIKSFSLLNVLRKLFNFYVNAKSQYDFNCPFWNNTVYDMRILIVQIIFLGFGIYFTNRKNFVSLITGEFFKNDQL